GLDHVANGDAADAADLAADGADDADGEGVIEAEGVADGHRLLADDELRALGGEADRHQRRAVAAIDAEHGDVLGRIDADDLRGQRAVVIEGDVKAAALGDDVKVGDDVALLV